MSPCLVFSSISVYFTGNAIAIRSTWSYSPLSHSLKRSPSGYYALTSIIRLSYKLCTPNFSHNRLQIVDIVLQVDYLGSFLGLDYFHLPIEGMSNVTPAHPLLTIFSMTFLVWGLGSSAVSSLSVSIVSTLPPFTKTKPFVVGMTGIVGIFIPFSHTIDLLYAIGGTIIFSGYIVYDTYLINARLSPDEYIMAAISLYLECVFISLLVCLLD